MGGATGSSAKSLASPVALGELRQSHHARRGRLVWMAVLVVLAALGVGFAVGAATKKGDQHDGVSDLAPAIAPQDARQVSIRAIGPLRAIPDLKRAPARHPKARQSS